MTDFTKGQKVYDLYGVEGEFVSTVDGMFLVRPLYVVGDGEVYAKDITAWDNCFSTPPLEKLHAKVEELDKTITEKRAELKAINSEVAAFERSEKERMGRIKQHEGLEELDLFLSGEVTHYVAVHEYYPEVEIIPIGDTVEGYASANEYGLLKLMPWKGRDKKVRCSVYYKPSSSGYSKTEEVYLCCGEEAAKAKAAKLTQEMVGKYKGMAPVHRNHLDRLAGSCARWGVELPNTMVVEQMECIRKIAAQKIDKLKQEIATLEASIRSV